MNSALEVFGRAKKKENLASTCQILYNLRIRKSPVLQKFTLEFTTYLEINLSSRSLGENRGGKQGGQKCWKKRGMKCDITNGFGDTKRIRFTMRRKSKRATFEDFDVDFDGHHIWFCSFASRLMAGNNSSGSCTNSKCAIYNHSRRYTSDKIQSLFRILRTYAIDNVSG